MTMIESLWECPDGHRHTVRGAHLEPGALVNCGAKVNLALDACGKRMHRLSEVYIDLDASTLLTR